MAIKGWALVRIRESTKAHLEKIAEGQDIGIDKIIVNTLGRLAELEGQNRFPLNVVPGDFRDVWGHPLLVWRNGTLYLCPHGALLVILPDGQYTWLASGGHTCDFTPCV